MERVLGTIRVGYRSLRRTPGFTAAAVLALALGIGLSTAVFTVADALLLRRLPVRDQDRLVVLWGQTRDGRLDNWPLGVNDARDFVRQSRSLARAAFFFRQGASPVLIRDADRMSRLRRALVSGAFFDVLGARPELGRALGPTDDMRGAAPVLVLSHAAWQQRFGGDSGVLGRQIVMHGTGTRYRVVGVMPQGLDFPPSTDFWAPFVPGTTIPGMDSTWAEFDVLGRLSAGATPNNARDELSAFFARPDGPAGKRPLRGVVHTLSQLVLGDTRPALFVFAVASGILLLITCVNVANLLLVRGLGRVREIAVRSALGAGRGRIVFQLLLENSLLALAGGAAGLAVAATAVRTFVAFAAAGVPRLDEIRLNSTALAGAIGITGVAMLIFSLAPVVMTSRVELQQVLRSDLRQTGSPRSRLATEVLVAGQVALALIVLSAAGLMGRSLLKLENAKLSLEPSRLLIGELALRYDAHDNVEKEIALLEELLPELKAIPGVRSVSPAVAVPFSGSGGWDGRFGIDGQSPEEVAHNPLANLEVVAPEYFATLAMPVLRGRGFTDADRKGAPPVVVISESVARLYWPGADPIGKRLLTGPNEGVTVVGVVPDTRYRDLRDARSSVYYPLRQSPFPVAPMTLLMRTSGPPNELVPAIRRVIGETTPGAALASAAPFATFLEGPLAQPRLNALLLAVFAVSAVVLAAVGLFGVMSAMVRRRTRELGVRMALGATAADLRRMVLRRGLAIAATGSALGLIGALLANRLLAALLYEVSPTDGATLALVTAFLFGVAALASLIPARATTRIDAAIALRAEG